MLDAELPKSCSGRSSKHTIEGSPESSHLNPQKHNKAEPLSKLGLHGLIKVAPRRSILRQQRQHHRTFCSLLGGYDPGVPVDVSLDKARVHAVDVHARVPLCKNSGVGIEHCL